MVTRKTGLFGNFSEIERPIITFIHKPSRAPQPFPKIVIGNCRICVFFSHRRAAASCQASEILQRVRGKRKRFFAGLAIFCILSCVPEAINSMLRVSAIVLVVGVTAASLRLPPQEPPKQLPGPFLIYGPVHTIRDERTTFRSVDG